MKTDAEVKTVVYTVIGKLMDAGWVMGQSDRPEIQEMGAKFIEEARDGEVWWEEIEQST
jgi:hypothetical protein